MVLRKAAIIGNVDNGKSTLIGQLLRQTGELKSDQIHKVERLSQLGGRSFTDLSLCTDGLETEVKEAKTIDISFKFIDTPGVRIQLADCPGHLEYFTKTASALSNSEVLVLVLDINSGITAQTSFLLKMAKFFELNSIIVCVNKMDTVGFCAATFEKVASAIKEISEGLEIKCKVIPTSGKTGENLVGRTEKLVWWKGETLMDCLEKQIEIEDKSEEDTWLGVQNVFGGSFSGASEQVQGFLLSGALRPGDFLQNRQTDCSVEIKSVTRWGKNVPFRIETGLVEVRVESKKAGQLRRGDWLVAEKKKADPRCKIKGVFLDLDVGNRSQLTVPVRLCRLFQSEMAELRLLESESDLSLRRFEATLRHPWVFPDGGGPRELRRIVATDPKTGTPLGVGFVD